MRPQSLPEWISYIKSLSPVEFRDQLQGVNTFAFFSNMKKEGTPYEKVKKILALYKERARILGVDLPSGGVVIDWVDLKF